MPLASICGERGTADALTLEWMYSEEENNITPIYVLPIQNVVSGKRPRKVLKSSTVSIFKGSVAISVSKNTIKS